MDIVTTKKGLGLTSQAVHIAPAGADSAPEQIADAAERVGRIKGAARQDDTHIMLPSPLACDWRLTWTSDDVQLAGVADGAVNEPDDAQAFHTRMYEVRGTPPEFTVTRVASYPDMVMRAIESDFASYWGGSVLAVDGEVYKFLWTANHPYLREDGSFWPDFRAAAAKLIYSPDNGATWHNQDGSHPVVWENWDSRTRDNMVFLDEVHEGLAGGGSFLQMGQDYSLNTDGYVYAYFGLGDGNELSVWRVPRGRVRDRGSYEFYTGARADGIATWSPEPAAAVALLEFPPGWVSTKADEGMMPRGWDTSVVYNPGLGVYLLAAQGVAVGEDGGWYVRPSYLGFWAAPTPWGPFTQFHEETAWTPGGNEDARAFRPDIAPKWISADGTSFWLVWSDVQYRGDNGEDYNPDATLMELVRGIRDDAEFIRVFAGWVETHMPANRFHTQRVELTVRDEASR